MMQRLLGRFSVLVASTTRDQECKTIYFNIERSNLVFGVGSLTDGTVALSTYESN